MGAISMFFEKKEFDKSLKIIKTANLNFPNNYELTAQAANCYLMKKDTVTALTKYEEAYSIFPNQELAQFLSKKYEESGDSAKSNFYKKTQQIN